MIGDEQRKAISRDRFGRLLQRSVIAGLVVVFLRHQTSWWEV